MRPGLIQPSPSQTSQDGSFWMHELSYSSLESNDSGYTQQPWLPDDLCAACMICGQQFHLWRRMHHCRDCGGLFCRECSSHRVASTDEREPLRVCDRCAFSATHPEHLGCERPLACPRCSPPRNASQCWIYLTLFCRLVACCALCPLWDKRKLEKEMAAATTSARGVGSAGPLQRKHFGPPAGGNRC